MAIIPCDIVITGGGLSGALIALALAKTHPRLNVMLVEKEDAIGGNRIWSFFAEDVAPAHRWLIAPLVSFGWAGHGVRFPGHSRDLSGLFYCIEAERLDMVVRRDLPAGRVLTGRKVLACSPHSTILDDGTRIEAQAVIDTRGAADTGALTTGWQMVLGQMIELDEPHDIGLPVVMDARIGQTDGFRFIRALPLSPTSLYVEHIGYTEAAEPDDMAARARITAWLAQEGLKSAAVLREEKAMLPVVLDGDFDAYWQAGGPRIAKAGMRGGFFHPFTGQTLPDAVRTAVALTRAEDFGAASLHPLLKSLADRQWQAGKFYRTMAQMLFRADTAGQRVEQMARFYTLSESLIARFHAGQTNATDKLRILSGKPDLSADEATGMALPDLGQDLYGQDDPFAHGQESPITAGRS